MEQRLGVDFTTEFLKEKYPTAVSYPVVVIDGFYVGGYKMLAETVKTAEQDKSKFLTE